MIPGAFLDISDWERVSKSSGTKDGFWVVHPRTRRQGLVKKARFHERNGFYEGEAWSERLASLLGQALTLPVPEVDVVHFEGKLCPLSWDIKPYGWELREGVALAQSAGRLEPLLVDDVLELLGRHVGRQQSRRSLSHLIAFASSASAAKHSTGEGVGRHMNDVAEALLVWKHPIERSRFIIGRLKRGADGYTYQNVFDEQPSLSDAIAKGFTPLDPFGVERTIFKSGSLFPFFARRLPPEWRREEYSRLGLKEGDDIEYLVKTGGRMSGDAFEFFDPVQSRNKGRELKLDFPVAGWRYYDGESVIDELKPGTTLRLELDRENPHDNSAIRILSPSDALLGYVPRVYSWYFDDCVEEQRYSAAVKAIGPETDPQLRMVVCFELPGHDARLRQVPEGLDLLAPA